MLMNLLFMKNIKKNFQILNLNMIFHCDNEKYEIRHSTADWRKENTVGNKPKDMNNGKENHMKIKEECLNSNNKLKF